MSELHPVSHGCPYSDDTEGHDMFLEPVDDYLMQMCAKCGLARTFSVRNPSDDSLDSLTADDVERRFFGKPD